ncbi:auxin response factor family protein [Candidatus Woesearchaeota archaeon]|nr:auxin response factor family protein [Candidatus Woesearchaeota archaeon]
MPEDETPARPIEEIIPELEEAFPEVAKLVSRVNEDPDYIGRLLLTLELNKIDRDYQKLGQPIVYHREVDEIGLVVSFSLDPFYKSADYEGEEIPPPEETFSDQGRVEIMQHLGEECILGILEGMLACQQVEQYLLGFFGINTSPFDKLYDERGFIVAAKPLFKMSVEGEEPSERGWMGMEYMSFLLHELRSSQE